MRSSQWWIRAVLVWLMVALFVSGCRGRGARQAQPTLVRIPAETKEALQTALAATLLAQQQGLSVPTPSVTTGAVPTSPATPALPTATLQPSQPTPAPEPTPQPSAVATAPGAGVASYVEHTVAWGENLTRIARRYGVSVEAIVQANGIANPSQIYVGQVLRIPVSGALPPTPTVVGTPTPVPGFDYVVQAGDTLSGIAERFGVSLADLMRANGLSYPGLIYAGQTLRIPAEQGSAAPAAAAPAAATPSAEASAEAAALTAGPPSSPITNLAGKIAFQLASGGDIYVVNADGSGLRRLTDGLDPAWSPDGRMLAFVRWRFPFGLYVIGERGDNERMLLQQNLLKSPTWSPDGQWIAFTREEPGRPAERLCYPRFGCVEIPERKDWLLGVIRVSDGARDDPRCDLQSLSPSWGLQGDWIVYDGERGLRATKPGAAPWTVVDDIAAAFPSVSPDGARVAFMYQQHDHWEIYLVNADGTGLRPLTQSSPLADRPAQNVAPAWSPDGKRILFLSNRDGRWRPYIMNEDGSGQEPFLPEVFDQFTFSYEFAAERVFSWR